MSQAVFLGLDIVVPLMTGELLAVPKLARLYFGLLSYLLEIWPDRVAALPGGAQNFARTIELLCHPLQPWPDWFAALRTGEWHLRCQSSPVWCVFRLDLTRPAVLRGKHSSCHSAMRGVSEVDHRGANLGPTCRLCTHMGCAWTSCGRVLLADSSPGERSWVQACSAA